MHVRRYQHCIQSGCAVDWLSQLSHMYKDVGRRHWLVLCSPPVDHRHEVQHCLLHDLAKLLGLQHLLQLHSIGALSFVFCFFLLAIDVCNVIVKITP